jgi:hypothetical protein
MHLKGWQFEVRDRKEENLTTDETLMKHGIPSVFDPYFIRGE